MLLLSSADFFFIKINFQEQSQSAKRFRIWIRTDVLSVLVWFQTVCKCNLQTTKVASIKERVKMSHGMRFPIM